MGYSTPWVGKTGLHIPVSVAECVREKAGGDKLYRRRCDWCGKTSNRWRKDGLDLGVSVSTPDTMRMLCWA